MEKVFQSFQMEKSKLFSTPLATHFKFDASVIPSTEEDKDCMSRVLYSNAVGSLMYAMVCTRLDLAHAICVVSRFMSNLGKTHWEAVKWIIGYLRGTSNLCMVYSSNGSTSDIVGYIDSYYGGGYWIFAIQASPSCLKH